MHDHDYRASKADWDSFVESLTEKIIEVDDTIPELPPKDLVSYQVISLALFFTKLDYCRHFEFTEISVSRKTLCVFLVSLKLHPGHFALTALQSSPERKRFTFNLRSFPYPTLNVSC